MAKKKLKTVLTFVQDETGSMFGIQDRTRSAFNEYFDTLKNEKKIGDVEVLVWQFSQAPPEQRVRKFHAGALADVPEMTADSYRPRGITPLFDAVGTAIQQAEAKKADRYLFIVQTDGLENASVDFSREQIAKLVSEKEASENWTVVFLGTGINNWKNESVAMGAQASSAVPFVAHATGDAYASLATTSGAFLRTNAVKGQTLAADTEKELKKRTTPKS